VTEQPPRRVRVTSPRTGATARPPARAVTDDIDELTGVGEVYVRSLLRTQLRLGLGVLGAGARPVGAVPLLFAVAPSLRTVEVAGVPLPWLLPAVLAYPVLSLVAWAYVRAAERAERDFADLVQRR
jgi:hypothetical protein